MTTWYSWRDSFFHVATWKVRMHLISTISIAGERQAGYIQAQLNKIRINR